MNIPVADLVSTRSTADRWCADDPVLDDGTVGVEQNTGLFKIGDGITRWNRLLYGPDGGRIPFPLEPVPVEMHGNEYHTEDYITADQAPVQPEDLHHHINKSVLDLITNAGSGKIITGEERNKLNNIYSKEEIDNRFIRDSILKCVLAKVEG